MYIYIYYIYLIYTFTAACTVACTSRCMHNKYQVRRLYEVNPSIPSIHPSIHLSSHRIASPMFLPPLLLIAAHL